MRGTLTLNLFGLPFISVGSVESLSSRLFVSLTSTEVSHLTFLKLKFDIFYILIVLIIPHDLNTLK